MKGLIPLVANTPGDMRINRSHRLFLTTSPAPMALAIGCDMRYVVASDDLFNFDPATRARTCEHIPGTVQQRTVLAAEVALPWRILGTNPLHPRAYSHAGNAEAMMPSGVEGTSPSELTHLAVVPHQDFGSRTPLAERTVHVGGRNEMADADLTVPPIKAVRTCPGSATAAPACR
jgi:hypothetical protein